MHGTYVEVGEVAAAKRRLLFDLVDATDGFSPETAEAGGQPEISVDGAAFTATGIGTLVAIGNGLYYADLTTAQVAAAHPMILGRFKSAATREARSLNVIEVGGHREALAALRNDNVFDADAGTTDVYDNAGYAGGTGNKLFTHTLSDLGSNKTLNARS